jgi:hypothetical protein
MKRRCQYGRRRAHLVSLITWFALASRCAPATHRDQGQRRNSVASKSLSPWLLRAPESPQYPASLMKRTRSKGSSVNDVPASNGFDAEAHRATNRMRSSLGEPSLAWFLQPSLRPTQAAEPQLHEQAIGCEGHLIAKNVEARSRELVCECLNGEHLMALATLTLVEAMGGRQGSDREMRGFHERPG